MSSHTREPLKPQDCARLKGREVASTAVHSDVGSVIVEGFRAQLAHCRIRVVQADSAKWIVNTYQNAEDSERNKVYLQSQHAQVYELAYYGRQVENRSAK